MYLQPRDEESLLDRYHSQHDVGARDELVERYLPLVRSLAKRYSYTSEPIEDLCQVGAIALCKAIDRYRPGCGASFKAYAVPTIVGEMRRHFRDTGWALHIPRSLQELSRSVGVAVNTLATQNARSPTIAEIAAFSGLTREQVIEGLDVRRAYDAASLDAGLGGDEEPPWLASLGADDAGFETVEQQALLERAMRSLPERERLLLHLRFSEDLSQSDIAKRVGVSQMHVSRMLRRAVGRLQAVTEAAPARSPTPS